MANAVAAWIHERGHRILGPHREVCLNCPIAGDGEDPLTEILFAIDAEDQS